MKGLIRKNIALFSLLVLLGVFFTQKANAASLSSVSDTITTSRPSASAPLAANQAASAGQVTIADNGSYFIASDTAVLWNDIGETLNSVNIASMSGANTPSANQRIVYFTNTAANTHHTGDPISVAVTAKHTVTFNTISTIPIGGKIIITFPGAGNNSASPSASTFAFNNLQTGNISASFSSGSSTCTFTITAPTITCTVATAQVNGAVTVTITIGSSTPALINPTKSPSQACVGSTTCTADTWKIGIVTQDSSSVTLDTGSARIALIESVQVQGTVEPTITFTITGYASATDVSSIGTSGCGSIISNSGIAATATFVDLGSFGPNFLNKAIQGLTVSTNGASGYAITATSSGRFLNPSTGQFFQDANGGNGLTANNTPVPAVISITGGGTQTFGIHACGTRSNILTDQWVNAGTAPDSGSNGTAKFSNPWNTIGNSFYNTLASYTGGPVAAETTGVVYAGTITATTPPGIYRTVYTYVATATF